MIKILEREISALDKAIDELVSSEPGLQSRSQLIQSIQGVGKITAWTLFGLSDGNRASQPQPPRRPGWHCPLQPR
jgi:transposase